MTEKLTREELEALALDCCPASHYYELADDIEIMQESDLMDIIGGNSPIFQESNSMIGN